MIFRNLKMFAKLNSNQTLIDSDKTSVYLPVPRYLCVLG